MMLRLLALAALAIRPIHGIEVESVTMCPKVYVSGDEVIDFVQINAKFDDLVYVPICGMTKVTIKVGCEEKEVDMPEQYIPSVGCVNPHLLCQSDPDDTEICYPHLMEMMCICYFSRTTRPFNTSVGSAPTEYKLFLESYQQQYQDISEDPTALPLPGIAPPMELSCPNFPTVKAYCPIPMFTDTVYWFRRMETHEGFEEMDKIIDEIHGELGVANSEEVTALLSRQVACLFPSRFQRGGSIEVVGPSAEELKDCTLSLAVHDSTEKGIAEGSSTFLFSQLKEQCPVCTHAGARNAIQNMKNAAQSIVTAYRSYKDVQCDNGVRRRGPGEGTPNLPGEGIGGMNFPSPGRRLSGQVSVGEKWKTLHSFLTPSKHHNRHLQADGKSVMSCSERSEKLQQHLEKTLERAFLETGKDAVAGCWYIVNRVLKPTVIQISTVTKECPFQQHEPEWESDPCCNPLASLFQCCSARTVTVPKKTVFDLDGKPFIDSTLLAGFALADHSGQARYVKKLYQTLLGYLESDAQAESGCRKQLKNKTGSVQDAAEIIENCFKGVQGEWSDEAQQELGMPCEDDDDCWGDVQCAPVLLDGLEARFCTAPKAGDAEPLTDCVLTKIGSEATFFMKKTMGLNPANGARQLAEQFLKKYGKEECRGPRVYEIREDKGVAWDEISRADCLSVKECNWDPSITERLECLGTGDRKFFCSRSQHGWQEVLTEWPRCEINSFNWELMRPCEEAYRAALKSLSIESSGTNYQKAKRGLQRQRFICMSTACGKGNQFDLFSQQCVRKNVTSKEQCDECFAPNGPRPARTNACTIKLLPSQSSDVCVKLERLGLLAIPAGGWQESVKDEYCELQRLCVDGVCPWHEEGDEVDECLLENCDSLPLKPAMPPTCDSSQCGVAWQTCMRHDMAHNPLRRLTTSKRARSQCQECANVAACMLHTDSMTALDGCVKKHLPSRIIAGMERSFKQTCSTCAKIGPILRKLNLQADISADVQIAYDPEADTPEAKLLLDCYMEKLGVAEQQAKYCISTCELAHDPNFSSFAVIDRASMRRVEQLVLVPERKLQETAIKNIENAEDCSAALELFVSALSTEEAIEKARSMHTYGARPWETDADVCRKYVYSCLRSLPEGSGNGFDLCNSFGVDLNLYAYFDPQMYDGAGGCYFSAFQLGGGDANIEAEPECPPGWDFFTLNTVWIDGRRDTDESCKEPLCVIGPRRLAGIDATECENYAECTQQCGYCSSLHDMQQDSQVLCLDTNASTKEDCSGQWVDATSKCVVAGLRTDECLVQGYSPLTCETYLPSSLNWEEEGQCTQNPYVSLGLSCALKWKGCTQEDCENKGECDMGGGNVWADGGICYIPPTETTADETFNGPCPCREDTTGLYFHRTPYGCVASSFGWCPDGDFDDSDTCDEYPGQGDADQGFPEGESPPEDSDTPEDGAQFGEAGAADDNDQLTSRRLDKAAVKLMKKKQWHRQLFAESVEKLAESHERVLNRNRDYVKNHRPSSNQREEPRARRLKAQKLKSLKALAKSMYSVKKGARMLKAKELRSFSRYLQATNEPSSQSGKFTAEEMDKMMETMTPEEIAEMMTELGTVSGDIGVGAGFTNDMLNDMMEPLKSKCEKLPASLKAEWIPKPTDKVECLKKKKCCTSSSRNAECSSFTESSEEDCQSVCGGRYTSVFSWKSRGQWKQGYMDTPEWIEKEMMPANSYMQTLTREGMLEVLEEANENIGAKPRVAFAKCRMGPFFSMLRKASACAGTDASNNCLAAEGISLGETTVLPGIPSVETFGGAEARFGASSITAELELTAESDPAASAQGYCANKQLCEALIRSIESKSDSSTTTAPPTSSTESARRLRVKANRALQTSSTPKVACYSVVLNSGAVVGQLIGDCLNVTTIPAEALTGGMDLCLSISTNIPQDPVLFPEYAFGEKSDGIYKLASVDYLRLENSGTQLCALVNKPSNVWCPVRRYAVYEGDNIISAETSCESVEEFAREVQERQIELKKTNAGYVPLADSITVDSETVDGSILDDIAETDGIVTTVTTQEPPPDSDFEDEWKKVAGDAGVSIDGEVAGNVTTSSASVVRASPPIAAIALAVLPMIFI